MFMTFWWFAFTHKKTQISFAGVVLTHLSNPFSIFRLLADRFCSVCTYSLLVWIYQGRWPEKQCTSEKGAKRWGEGTGQMGTFEGQHPQSWNISVWRKIFFSVWKSRIFPQTSSSVKDTVLSVKTANLRVWIWKRSVWKWRPSQRKVFVPRNIQKKCLWSISQNEQVNKVSSQE